MMCLIFLVTVPIYALKEGRKRCPRIDVCYYCEKSIKYRISRHYKCVHQKQKAVIDAEADPGVTQVEIAKLQHLGNFKHNCKVWFHSTLDW